MSKEIKLLKVIDCQKHPEAETLYIVKLWQAQAVTIDQFKKDDFGVYLPAGSRPPKWLTDALGITKYLDHGKVKSVKLRGVPSKGALYSLDRIKKIALDSKRDFKAANANEFDKFIDQKVLGGVPVPPKKKVVFNKFSVQYEETECQS